MPKNKEIYMNDDRILEIVKEKDDEIRALKCCIVEIETRKEQLEQYYIAKLEQKQHPIMKFKNDEELMQCLKEWQDRLYLNDWIIKAKLCPLSEMGNDLGNCDPVMSIKSSDIKICILNEDILHNNLVKVCHEQTLIHELLECIYERAGGEDLGAIILEEYMHAQLELMSRSLLMAKYRLTPDWFVNF